MKHTINGAAYRKMLLSAAASIEIQKQQINDLNVFPAPDGDTGTNMSMTLDTAAAERRRDVFDQSADIRSLGARHGDLSAA